MVSADQPTAEAQRWAEELLSVSLLKQQKLRQLSALLPPLEGLDCLDIGGDNGVVSLMLRRLGGRWTSADLDAASVAAIGALVGKGVRLIQAPQMPWPDTSLDCIVLADCLEHIQDDAAFVAEVARVCKPGGALIANVPLARGGFLRWLRQAIGQTDERHGHLRPGYSVAGLRALLSPWFQIDIERTYSRFFSQLVDALVVMGVGLLGGAKQHASKGTVVTQDKLGGSLRMAKLVYPLMWLLSQLDRLIFFRQGYMLVVKARRGTR